MLVLMLCVFLLYIVLRDWKCWWWLFLMLIIVIWWKIILVFFVFGCRIRMCLCIFWFLVGVVNVVVCGMICLRKKKVWRFRKIGICCMLLLCVLSSCCWFWVWLVIVGWVRVGLWKVAGISVFLLVMCWCVRLVRKWYMVLMLLLLKSNFCWCCLILSWYWCCFLV